MQAEHVSKVNAQYMGNVAMKVNAKLGGTTSRIAGVGAVSPEVYIADREQKNPALGHFLKPSIIIGADVSHASPGSLQASMAAITVSCDRKVSGLLRDPRSSCQASACDTPPPARQMATASR